MFARSPTAVIPRTRQATGTKLTMITIFFTGGKPVVLEILPKESKFNQLYFIDFIFLDLKKENVNFHGRIPQATFWVHMNSSMGRNGLKVASQFEGHHVSGLPHPPYSPDISLCDSWFFEIRMLNGVLENCEFNSSDKIE
jgi:hypothetical protein